MYSPIKNSHEDIKKKLDFFIKNDKVPNIIFHGQSGSGKRTIVNAFINDIPTRLANSTGTAFPICLYFDAIEPTNS